MRGERPSLSARVVTYARNESKRQIREFSGVQFLNEFNREPISYFARLK